MIEENIKPESSEPEDVHQATSTSDSIQEGDFHGNTAEVEWRPTLKFFGVMSVLMVLSLMAALEATAVSAGLEMMVFHLKGTSIEAEWVGSSFLLASAVIQPIVGSLSEIFGRRPLALITVLLFLVGSIMCAVANDFSLIIAGRTIQGLGGGGCLVLNEIIIADLVPLRERGKYYGFLGSMWALGTVIGPLLGGGFSTNVTWRWIFYINIPFCCIAFVMIWFLLNLKLEKKTMREKFRQIDWIGLVLFSASTTSFLLALIFGGVQFPWKSWHVLVPLILGVIGMVSVSIYETRVAYPMIDISVLVNRHAIIGYFHVFLHGLQLWLLIFYLPIYYQGSKGYSAILSAVALLPESVTVAPSAVAAGITIAITGRYLYLSYAAWGLMLLGEGLLIMLTQHTTVGQFIGLNIPFGLGAGIAYASLNGSVMAPNPPSKQGRSAAFLSFIRVLGQAVGVAIGGAVFSNRVGAGIENHPELSDYKDFSNQSFALAEILRHMPDTKIRTLLRDCLDNAMHDVFITCVALSALALVLLFAVKEYILDREVVASQGLDEKPLEKNAKEQIA